MLIWSEIWDMIRMFTLIIMKKSTPAVTMAAGRINMAAPKTGTANRKKEESVESLAAKLDGLF
ncbi:MAG: hypothetical protein LKG40_03030 [Lachnospiraceae bacterium]|nr:hypothetical protein [Lachnospiraceae bacterium]MCI1327746.1 hypothetical protein [Lachnospiraceae bacterium]